MPGTVHFLDLGRMPYTEAWRFQEKLQTHLIQRKRQKNPLPGYLLFVEHPHTYTLGKNGKWDHLLYSSGLLKEKGIEKVKTNRGGDITYHGPGQLVGYPILDLDFFHIGVARYMYHLEEVIIQTTKHFGVSSQRVDGRTGVWVQNNKICAMGIRCSRYVTMHGFALNIHIDLSFFDGIIPCGIEDGGVTSFEKLLNPAPSAEEVKTRLKNVFEEQFGCILLKHSGTRDLPGNQEQ